MDSMGREVTIIFEPAQEGGLTTVTPEIPRVVGEGETSGEARLLVLDAFTEVNGYRRGLVTEQGHRRACARNRD